MLNYLNALNLIGYVVNVFFTFFSTLIFDIKGPGELSDKYQTIITPTGFIFSIWGVIFIFQGIFTVVQMLKDFRAVDLVRSHSSGVSYWYFITCIAQSAWTILFGKEMILQSTIAMLIILYSLVQFVQNQSSQTNKSAKEIWLLTFPFQIHCGWIFCATMLNINVMAISMGAEGFFQTFLALISLGFLGVQAYLYLGLALGLFPPRHSPPTHVAVLTIPSVFAWATVHSSICAFLWKQCRYKNENTSLVFPPNYSKIARDLYWTFQPQWFDSSDLFENGNHHCHGAVNSNFVCVHHRRRCPYICGWLQVWDDTSYCQPPARLSKILFL